MNDVGQGRLRFAREPLVERFAFQQRHDDVRGAVRLVDVVDGNDVVIAKQSGGADYPVVAAAPGVRHSGATVRQTIIGLEFSGPPSIWGGRAHGSVYTDFFAGATEVFGASGVMLAFSAPGFDESAVKTA